MMTFRASNVFPIILCISIMKSEQNSDHDNPSHSMTLAAMRNFRLTTIANMVDSDKIEEPSVRISSGTDLLSDRSNSDNDIEESGIIEKKSTTDKVINNNIVTSRENFKFDNSISDKKSSTNADHDTARASSSQTSGSFSTEKSSHVQTDHVDHLLTDHNIFTTTDPNMIRMMTTRRDKRLTSIHPSDHGSSTTKKSDKLSETHKRIPDDHEKSGKSEKKPSIHTDHHLNNTSTEKVTTTETSEKTTHKFTKKSSYHSSVEYSSITSSPIVESTTKTTLIPMKLIFYTVKKNTSTSSPDYGVNSSFNDEIFDKNSTTSIFPTTTLENDEKLQDKTNGEGEKNRVSQENHIIGPSNQLVVDSEKKFSTTTEQATHFKVTTEKEYNYQQDSTKMDKKLTTQPTIDQNGNNSGPMVGTVEKDDTKITVEPSSTEGRRTSLQMNLTFFTISSTASSKRNDSELKTRTEKNSTIVDFSLSTEKMTTTNDSQNILGRSEQEASSTTPLYSRTSTSDQTPVYSKTSSSDHTSVHSRTSSSDHTPVYSRTSSSDQTSVYSRTGGSDQTPVYSRTGGSDPTTIYSRTSSSDPTPVYSRTSGSDQTPVYSRTSGSDPTTIYSRTSSSDPTPVHSRTSSSDQSVGNNSIEDLVNQKVDQNNSYRIFSGYLSVPKGKHLHYVFVESSNNLENDPIILWLEGPGCSGLIPAFTENGPFMLKKNSSSFTVNPHSWNKMANLLYFEAHENLGYSYTDSKQSNLTDDIVIENVINGLKYFYEKFPNHRTNDLYLGGRGPAVVMVLLASVQLLNETNIPYKGFIVENGCFDSELSDNSKPFLGYQKRIVNKTGGAELAEKCCGKTLETIRNCKNFNPYDQQCKETLIKLNRGIDNLGANIYNIHDRCKMSKLDWQRIYFDAWGQARASLAPFVNGDPKNHLHGTGEKIKSRDLEDKPTLGPAKSLRNEPSKLGNVDQITSPPLLGRRKRSEKNPCFQHEELKSVLNEQNHRAALHIRNSSPPWTSCDQTFAEVHQHVYKSVKNQLLQVLNAEKRGLVYMGDLNLHCNHLGSFVFMEELSLPLTAERQPYHLDNQTVGMFKELKHNLTYITIQDSGYFVSINQPDVAYRTVETFIKGRKFA